MASPEDSSNTTSRTIRSRSVSASHTRYRLEPSYPTSLAFRLREANLALCVGTCTHAVLPNTLRCDTSGFRSSHSSYGVFVRSLVGLRLVRYTAQWSASAHSLSFSPLSNSWLRTLVRSVLILRSATPFCSGLYGAVGSHCTPRSRSMAQVRPLPNSPPLSERSRPGNLPRCVFIAIRKSRRRA